MSQRKPKTETSWQQVGHWYDKAVGREGHYYHQNIVLPGALRLLAIDQAPPQRLLDLGCGQGVLARQLPPGVEYLGLDLASQLIKQAKTHSKNRHHSFLVHDITEPFPPEKPFDAAAIILALQNIEHPERVIRNVSSVLSPQGKLLIVLNHPCFRIPRQSFWQVDPQKQCRYRRLERYLSPLKIPIQMNPSQGDASAVTWSFHHPLSSYSRWLHEHGFVIQVMEEWCSDKVSTGKAARMENLSRQEFPLFLAILAIRSNE
jgi:ubiquinone/menaquinone biosynthesis C-methylase UbiE